MSRSSISSNSSRRSSSNSTAVSEEIWSLYEEKDTLLEERKPIYALPIPSLRPTRQIASADASDHSNLLPNTSEPSASGTVRRFPPRKPIRRSLFVSEEDIIPLPSFLTKAEPLSSALPDPISTFHEATNYAYLPASSRLSADPIHLKPTPMTELSTQPAGQAHAGGIDTPFGLSKTIVSTLKDAVHALYQSVFVKRYSFFCNSSGAEWEGEKVRGNQSEQRMNIDRAEVADLQAYREHKPEESLFPPMRSSLGYDFDSEEEEEEEVEALLKYGVYCPPVHSINNLCYTGLPDRLSPRSTWLDREMNCSYHSRSPVKKGPRSSASHSSESGRSDRALLWDELSVSHTGEQLVSPLRGAAPLAPCLSYPSEHSRTGSQH
ncbi:hypothetical protein GYMLUDRAFT_904754 [Collybiopsis luxurians FD-317 M1]|uniref:Uncharacterized protein n=1 Tax=Collybiopsis luxurians FD-317 M1 TaxID=944289 RepID=A0A0D0BXB0_9AGAR|nr:hypothetical protein GYMLUDRAFT_904754 [Collybiopsis luxurians FD-317 M1]